MLKRAFVLCVLPILALAACEEEEEFPQKPLEGSEGSDDSDGGDGGETGDEDLPCGGESSGIECWAWEPQCPPGEKCVVWGDQEGIPIADRRPQGTKCMAVACDAAEPGDTCTAEGGFLTGVDDCDRTSQCWVRDFQNDQAEDGVCVPMCGGDSGVGNRFCGDPENRACVVFEGFEFFGLCMPRCNPLEQRCHELFMPGHSCLPNDDEVFTCNVYMEGASGAAGDTCWYYNECNPGLVCADPEELAGCDSGSGCCTPLCDTTAGNSCPGAANGEECVDIWADPLNPDVGACTIPP